MTEETPPTPVHIAFHHAGVVVENLDRAAAFFEALGFRRDEPIEMVGTWLDRIVGLNGAHSLACYVTPPGGGGSVELVEFRDPHRVAAPPDPPTNAHGVRHLAFQTSDVAELVDRARRAGYGLVGEVVDFADEHRVVYVRGPEGLIVEFAQSLRPTSGGS